MKRGTALTLVVALTVMFLLNAYCLWQVRTNGAFFAPPLSVDDWWIWRHMIAVITVNAAICFAGVSWIIQQPYRDK